MSEIGILIWGASGGRKRSQTSRRPSKAAEFRRGMLQKRVRSKTQRFVSKYKAILKDIRAQGLDQYVAGEIRRAERRLDEVRRLLRSDPFAARSLNMEVGQLVGPLPRLARSRRAQERAAQREQVRKKRSRGEAGRIPSGGRLDADLHGQETTGVDGGEPVPTGPSASDLARQAQHFRNVLINEFDGLIDREFADPIVLDFAYDQLRALRDELEGAQLHDQTAFDAMLSDLRQRVAEIRDSAARAADEWRARHEQPAELMIIQEEISDLETTLPPNAEAGRQILEELKALRDAVRSGTVSGKKLVEELKEKVEAADEAVVDEECRREVVRAMYDALQRQGFVIEPPRRIVEGGRDRVVLTARKPAGQSAQVEVAQDGTVRYEFLNYQGMECKKDVDKVVELLEKVYNIPIDDREVIWQNPDRISKDARPLPGSSKSQGKL